MKGKKNKGEKLFIEILGMYDGVCVEYDFNTDTFEWRDLLIERLSEEERTRYEDKFREDLNK